MLASPAIALTSASAVALTCFEATDTHVIGAWGRIGVVIWRTETTGAAAAAFRRHLIRHFDGVDGPLGLLTIVEEHAKPPSAEARAEIAGYFEAHGARIVHSAVVVEGGSMRAAFVRSVATGLAMLARMPFPHRVMTLDAACDAYEQVLGGHGFVSSGLFPAIEQLRRS